MIKKIYFILFLVFTLFLPVLSYAEENDCPQPIPEVKGISQGYTEDELSIYITWIVSKELLDDNNTVNFGYKIFKKGPGGEAIIGTISPEEVTDSTDKYYGFYNDPLVVSDETYTYSVSLFDSVGNEYPAGSVTVKAELEKYEDEKECVATITVEGQSDDNGNVDLSWNEVCDADEYRVFRDGTQLGSTDQTNATDENVKSGKYLYKVEAWGPKKESSNNTNKREIHAGQIISIAKAEGEKDKKVEGSIILEITKDSQSSNLSIPSTNNLPKISIDSLLKDIIKIIIALAWILLVIMLMISGVIFITSHGDEERVNLAKKIAKYAIMGAILILFIYAIAEFIKITFS